MVRQPIQPRRRRTNLLLYLLLNVLVSAATTLVVLAVWDASRGNTAVIPTGEPVPAANLPAPTQPLPTPTLPPLDSPVIEIISIIGVGDLQQETVVLQRTGAGDLRMVGWKLQGERNNAFTFPEQPELVLKAGATVEVFSKPGDDTVTGFYWSRAEPAWQSGETVRLLDTAGNERAVYQIP